MTDTRAKLADLGTLLLRAGIGMGMAYHGLGKIPRVGDFTATVAEIGFPFPAFFAWCAILAEFGGGLLLALGLGTRIAAGFIAFTMMVAYYRVATTSGTVNEMALLYLLPALFFLLAGGGRLSFDALVMKRFLATADEDREFV
jgi:putative oxidoreductase